MGASCTKNGADVCSGLGIPSLHFREEASYDNKKYVQAKMIEFEPIVNDEGNIYVIKLQGEHKADFTKFKHVVHQLKQATKMSTDDFEKAVSKYVELHDQFIQNGEFFLPTKKGGKKTSKKGVKSSKWIRTSRTVQLKSGRGKAATTTTKTVYKSATTGELRVKKMVTRNGQKKATYVKF